jgi:serine/threonine protein kinase
MGSKTKIYIVLEYVTGGELFDTIVSHIHIVHSSIHKFQFIAENFFN